MPSKIGELIASAVAPVLKSVGQDKLVEVLDKLHEKNPEIHKTVLTSLYGPIDVHLEDLTDESKNPVDDAVVDALKGAIETSAVKYGVSLQNLDND